MENQVHQMPEIKIVYSIPNFSSRMKIRQTSDIRTVIEPYMKDILLHHEEIWAILLNNANLVLGAIQLGVGIDTETPINTKALYQSLILSNTKSFILVHNHPSGNLQASREDDALTTKVQKGAKLLDFVLLDHVILTYEGLYSYADEGKLF